MRNMGWRTGGSLGGILLLVWMLVGCGSTHQPAGQDHSISPEAASTQANNPSPDQKRVELTVSAAASLTESLKELTPLFEAKHPNIHVTYNFGASGALQQQIEQGAPVDVFISAARKQMDTLLGKKMIHPDYSYDLLENELVVIGASDQSYTLTSLADLQQSLYRNIAIGTPESVPAGLYSKEALTAENIWEALKEKTVLTKDVKQVLTYVETGNTEVGFVYKTDALSSKKVKILYTIDKKLHKPIIYPVGIVAASKQQSEALQFFRYLQSDEASDIFGKYGFARLSGG